MRKLTEVLTEGGNSDNPVDRRPFGTVTLGLVHRDKGAAVARAETLPELLSPSCYLVKMTSLTVRTYSHQQRLPLRPC